MNKEYAEIATRSVFGQSDKRKISRRVFHKELVNAARYGNINGIQAIASKHKKDPYQSVDEMLGDLEILACEESRKMKIDLNLKVPFIQVDNIVRD